MSVHVVQQYPLQVRRCQDTSLNVEECLLENTIDTRREALSGFLDASVLDLKVAIRKHTTIRIERFTNDDNSVLGQDWHTIASAALFFVFSLALNTKFANCP